MYDHYLCIGIKYQFIWSQRIVDIIVLIGGVASLFLVLVFIFSRNYDVKITK